jgi:hypothetical protein
MTMQYNKLFEPVAMVLTTPTTIFTVPSTVATTLLRGGIVRITNHTAGPVSATLHNVPLAGSAANANMCLPTTSIGANSYLDVQLPQMKAGDFLQGFASAGTSLNIQAVGGAYYSS